ncbi:MAG: hypothetical protein AB7O73_07085 [Bacteroidia bacterium]
MKKLVSIVYFISILNSAWSQKSNSIIPADLYFSALQGNVKIIIDKLDSVSDGELDKEQLSFKNKYLHRFRFQDEDFDYKTKDTVLVSIIKIYQQYWKSILLQNKNVEAADSALKEKLTAYLYSTVSKNKNIPQDTIANNFTEYTKQLLNARGFGVANGKTAGYYDLLVWAKESTVNFDVVLLKTKIKVKVVFMDSIITMGWEEYATFGTYFPGGWATSDALFCVRSTYDLESENFKISYLKHEGQHFADYKLYPELSGADLEYRAKLIELSYAQSSIYNLISFFLGNSSRDRNNSHAFANNCVMRDLSKKIFGKEMETDLTKWKNIPIKKINKLSKKLLEQNSANLKKQPTPVKEFIN